MRRSMFARIAVVGVMVALCVSVPAIASAATAHTKSLGAWASAARYTGDGGYVYCDVFGGSDLGFYNLPGMTPERFSDESIMLGVYELDTQGTQDPTDDVIRMSTGWMSPFDVGIDRKLTTASAVVDLEITVEEYLASELESFDGESEWPTPLATWTESASVQLDWLGDGSLIKDASHYRTVTPTGRSMDRSNTTYRDATVRGTVTVGDGRLEFTGDEFMGQLYQSTSGSVWIGDPWVY